MTFTTLIKATKVVVLFIAETVIQGLYLVLTFKRPLFVCLFVCFSGRPRKEKWVFVVGI